MYFLIGDVYLTFMNVFQEYLLFYRMVAIVGSPNKQDVDVKLPITHNRTVPKKDPVAQNVLSIKLPLGNLL